MNLVRGLPSVCVLAVGCFFSDAAHAATVQLSPSRDTTIFSDDATASNGAGPVFFAGRTNRGAGALRRAIVYFDVSSIPAGSAVTAVTVVLSVTREPGTPPQDGSLRRVLVSWGEAGSSITLGNGAPALPGDATWTDRFFGSSGQTWTTAGGDLAGAASATASFGSAGTTVTFGSTPQLVADVQSWIDAAANNQGWAILGDESVIGSATQFASRENSNGALRPRLVVTYTPPQVASDVPALTPVGLALMVAGLLGTGLLQLRRRSASAAGVWAL